MSINIYIYICLFLPSGHRSHGLRDCAPVNFGSQCWQRPRQTPSVGFYWHFIRLTFRSPSDVCLNQTGKKDRLWGETPNSRLTGSHTFYRLAVTDESTNAWRSLTVSSSAIRGATVFICRTQIVLYGVCVCVCDPGVCGDLENVRGNLCQCRTPLHGDHESRKRTNQSKSRVFCDKLHTVSSSLPEAQNGRSHWRPCTSSSWCRLQPETQSAVCSSCWPQVCSTHTPRIPQAFHSHQRQKLSRWTQERALSPQTGINNKNKR